MHKVEGQVGGALGGGRGSCKIKKSEQGKWKGRAEYGNCFSGFCSYCESLAKRVGNAGELWP